MSERSGWRIEADLDLCQGHQMCVLDDPEIFGFDRDEDRVTILQAQPGDAARPAAEAAVRHCPAMALTIIESVEEDWK
jgi:ferredoxin